MLLVVAPYRLESNYLPHRSIHSWYQSTDCVTPSYDSSEGQRSTYWFSSAHFLFLIYCTCHHDRQNEGLFICSDFYIVSERHFYTDYG